MYFTFHFCSCWYFLFLLSLLSRFSPLKLATYNGWHCKCFKQETTATVLVAFKDQEITICWHLTSNSPAQCKNSTSSAKFTYRPQCNETTLFNVQIYISRTSMYFFSLHLTHTVLHKHYSSQFLSLLLNTEFSWWFICLCLLFQWYEKGAKRQILLLDFIKIKQLLIWSSFLLFPVSVLQKQWQEIPLT